ncbi:mannosyl-glycoprotein endo-beta-N-acetylglucosamidase [Alteromonas sp. KS69]|jgi:Bax protein|uniref:glucosaminidase domain-containing protein n=1 Tax=unclassified Alteromonas TaxID=2614992 RepID=UPI000C0EA88B|nr:MULTISPECIES: glucosaminidase domain-containing protein [unclassified Alteromonas]MBB66949.1 mannosyl-glycoprotein endo-beta-N-acetylglucosamidase [Rickettsiales bacterium]MBO7922248.1 glucosaminidase domain-containing protein [Alteromonas sp. K632G]PHS58968.1 MAG: mannosyl-glycoprotein endo-beta-N-acetylglucosamidase [Alteromonas sp.]RUP77255.1 mannosyl-glycoprotein endo-beta-N-acetylglucosamidase [Alteromonas sp. KS69]|tara:strand:+ start:4805 stop:5596 length:792 start_codon:yes stop_codon:yes gene_type:complete
MHKRETLKIVLITIAVLAVIVINALILTKREPDILDIPETPEATKPVPDFSAYTDVKEKKSAFFDYLRPEVEKQNAYLLTLRHYIQTLYRKALNEEPLTDDDISRLEWLQTEYRVKAEQPLTSRLLALLHKIDILPAELVLVQAANESAWGTSRFARKGYNFFGIWCFVKGCGFVPGKRNAGATHEVAKFPSLSRATYTYMRNLNRHDAYTDLREIRERLRANQIPITGVALAEGLMNYSERGAAYVDELQTMIRFNQEFLTE